MLGHQMAFRRADDDIGVLEREREGEREREEREREQFIKEITNERTNNLTNIGKDEENYAPLGINAVGITSVDLEFLKIVCTLSREICL